MRIPLEYFLLFLLVSFLCSCQSEPATTVIEEEQGESSSIGLWRQLGYGRILELNDSTIRVFDLNEKHCMFTFEEDILDFAEVVGVIQDTLVLRHGIDLWKCIRINALPDLCSRETRILDEDPLLNFDHFWSNFNENYCSFGVKGIDWNEVRNKYRPLISEKTSQLELYSILQEIMLSLDDKHVKMSAPDNIEDAYDANKDHPKREFNMLDVFDTGKRIAELYVDSLRSFNAGMTRWGMIAGSIGYVQINSMLMQADYGLDADLTLMEFEKPYWHDNVSKHKDEIYRKHEAAGMKKTLNRVIADLEKAQVFVIDVRFNGRR